MATLDPQQQELLSAYLDGETTPAERAEVELLIEKDAEARRLLAELRTVRQSVRRVPSPTLGEGFTAELLAKIESQTPEQEVNPSEEEIEPRAFDWRRLRQRFFNPRSLAYAGTTVAVALLLMFLAPQDNRETALRDEVSTPTDEAVSDAPAENAYFSAPPEARGEEESLTLSTDADVMDKEAVDRLGRDATPKGPGAPPRAAEPAPMTVPAELPAMKSPMKPATRPEAKPEGMPGSAPDRSRGSERYSKSKDNGLSEGIAAEGIAAGGRAMDKRATSHPAKSLSRTDEQSLYREPVDVIRLNVTRKAADEGAVRQLLVDNYIEVQSAPEIAEELREEMQNKRGRREKKGVAKESNEIVVLIEAEPADLEAFLAEISTQPEQFPPTTSPGFGMGGIAGGGMGGAMGRPVPQMPVPNAPLPTTREPSAESLALTAEAKKEEDGKTIGQSRRKLDQKAPADAAALARNQAVILTDSDGPESVEMAQSRMQSRALFRRNVESAGGKLSETKQLLKSGKNAKSERVAGESPPLRQAIVVFAIVEPPAASATPAASTVPAAPAAPAKTP